MITNFRYNRSEWNYSKSEGNRRSISNYINPTENRGKSIKYRAANMTNTTEQTQNKLSGYQVSG